MNNIIYYEVGDVVYHMKLGVKMTVQQPDFKLNTTSCIWFDSKNALRNATFDTDELYNDEELISYHKYIREEKINSLIDEGTNTTT